MLMRMVFIFNTYNAFAAFFKQKIALLLILSKLYFVAITEMMITLND